MTGFRNTITRTTDMVTVIYLLITAAVFLIFDGLSSTTLIALLIRVLIFIGITALILIETKWRNNLTRSIHLLFPIFILSYIYGETSEINHFVFSANLDPYFIEIDRIIFGYQPSLTFSTTFPQKWFSELMYFGYFSLYLMTVSVCLVLIVKRPKAAEKQVFIILSSFFIYYLIFIVLPVVGPQFYYDYPLNSVPDSGIFSKAVRLVQNFGEKPTGAFPSSHVGMVMIYLYICYTNIKPMYWILWPFFIIIIFATVYIKAHYAIDVVGGIVTAPVIYILSEKFYYKISQFSKERAL